MSANASAWNFPVRDYVAEFSQSRDSVKFQPTTQHPLVPKLITAKSAKSVEPSPAPLSPAESSANSLAALKKPILQSAVDPLMNPLSPSQSSSPSKPTEFFDPLRQMAASAAEQRDRDKERDLTAAPVNSRMELISFGETKIDLTSAGEAGGSQFAPWRSKRAGILQYYSTNKKIPVSANFLEEDANSSESAESLPKPDANSSTKIRVEEIDSRIGDNQQAKLFMSQKEYIAHIEEQHQRLKDAWEAGERVLSLKIAIQCAKLLGDTNVPQFYLSMYVLLTDILDTFGDLVFDRIKVKGIEIFNPRTKVRTTGNLPCHFKFTDVSVSAQETCKNWRFKSSCIRELLPRLFIDMCLLKSYRFVESGDSFPLHFQRISRMIRGIGDPMVAAYARAYLATKMGDVHHSFTHEITKSGTATLIPKVYQAVLYESMDDFMYSFKHFSAEKFSGVRVVKEEKIPLDEYLDLFSPALDWLIQNIGFQAKEEFFFNLIRQYKEFCNCSFVLVHILNSFDPTFLANHALDMCNLFKEAEEIQAVPKSKLYLALGRALLKVPPPPSQRLPILNEVWKVVTKINSASEYLEIALVFVQYLLANFSDREVNIFLKDVLKHAKKDGAHKQLQDELAAIVEKVMMHCKDLNKTLAMDNLLPILDLLEKKHKVSASKAVLVQFSRSGFITADPVIIHTLFDVARSLHDSVDSLSIDEERKQIALLIINFVRQIDYGRDLEQQLNTYVECRSAFTNLDLVTSELVLRVALLATKAHRFMKGAHNKKTSSFVKACLAYNHITIPSLDDLFSRLRLFLLSAEVALVNGMIVQAEGFAKAAISLIPEVPTFLTVNNQILATEEELIGYLRHFSSFLLMFPGNPEHGPFYLVKGLINAIQSYDAWKSTKEDNSASTISLTSQVGKCKVYLALFSLFAAYAQPQFPYRINRVESNDQLYGLSDDYVSQLKVLADEVSTEIFSILSELGEKSDLNSKKHQGTLALEFANLLLNSVQIQAQSASLVVKLIQLAIKSGAAVDKSYLENTIKFIGCKKGQWFTEMINKLNQIKATN